MSNRCPSCGSPANLPHLRNCKISPPDGYELKHPTTAQIDFARDLIKQLGYNLEEYDFEAMSFTDLSKMITDLRTERGDYS
jgi:hypothetical protein